MGRHSRVVMGAWVLGLGLFAGACSGRSVKEKANNCPAMGLPCGCPDGTQSSAICLPSGEAVCQCPGGVAGTGGAGGVAGSGGAAGFAGTSGAGAVGGSGAIGGSGGAAGSAGIGGGGGVSGAAGSGAVGGNAGEGGIAGTAGSGGFAGNAGVGGSAGSNCLQGTGGDYSAMGPYAVTQSDVDIGGGLGMYTIFRPTNLDASCKHPMVAWGNGTGVTGSSIYGFYQTHAASWGMVVIASHDDQASSMAFLAGGLDYLIAQHQGSGSPLSGKLSDKAGTAGHSQGGFAATTAASHPNVVAEVCVQGGGRPPADVAFMCLTGTEDFVEPQCTAAYDSAAGPAFLANYQGADHMTTPTLGGYFQNNPGTKQYQRLYTAWFRCHLAGDETACAMFRGGANCGICGEPNWFAIEGKNF